MKNIISLVVLFFVLISSVGFTANQSGEITRTYRGLRPLGMGGAHIAIADDYNALFYNPAGLNSVKAWKVEILTLGIGLSSQIKNIYDNKDKLGGEITDMVQVVENSIGKNHHLGVEVVPSWVMHNFGIALVEDLKINIRIRNQAVPEIDANVKNDVVAVAGMAGRFWERFQLGFSVRQTYRFHSNTVLSALDVLNGDLDLDDIINEGMGTGVDLGLNYIVPAKWNQKVGLQISDFLGTKYDGGFDAIDGAGEPEKTKMAFNVGYKITPPGFMMFRPTFAVDFRDIFNSTKSSYFKRLHMGAEVKLPYIFKVRAGLGQGLKPSAFSLGFSADFWLLTFDFVTFAEELGVSQQNYDRRYYMRLSLGF